MWRGKESRPGYHLVIKKKPKEVSLKDVVQNYLHVHFPCHTLIFTDGSKDPMKGCVGAAVCVPSTGLSIKKRISNNLSVYTTELVTILLALQWIKANSPINPVVASDSYSALQSIQSSKSFRSDLINKIYVLLLEIMGVTINCPWVPAHIGVEGNEQVDMLAKETLQHKEVDLQIPVSKAEAKKGDT